MKLTDQEARQKNKAFHQHLEFHIHVEPAINPETVVILELKNI